MKHLLIIALMTITSIGANAQPPTQRPLPNQFRDYVDYSQGQERPTVERKDGKVVITMTQAQYRRMMRANRRDNTCRCQTRPMAYRMQPFFQAPPIIFSPRIRRF